MAPLLLGIDVGTTAAKVGAFGLDGRLAALASAGYGLNVDGATRAAEQDPARWWAAVQAALREVLAQVEPADVLAVCVGGQGPTLVAVDDALAPVAPALTWMDWRAQAEAGRLSQAAGRPLPAHAFVAKASWLRRERPETYARARWLCQAWDYVAMQLTGAPLVSTSPGIAPWTAEWLAVAELDEAKFPPLCDMGARLGQVTAAAAQATGLKAGLPVIGGISDYFEGLLGTGAVQAGLACDNGGTSQSFNVCWDAPLAPVGVFCIPSFMDGHWFVGGPVSTTGKALEWWCADVLGRAADDEALLAEAETAPAGSGGLVFVPYLAGERSPRWDPQARGVFFGLALHHQRAHLTRAVLEAVAYAICQLLEHIEAAGARVREIRVCGGQARSERWNRIKADVTGRSLVVPECAEAPVLGAAIIAGVGAGAFGNYVDAAERMVRPERVIEPDAERHARYRELFGIFCDLYGAVRPLYERLAAIENLRPAPAAQT